MPLLQEDKRYYSKRRISRKKKVTTTEEKRLWVRARCGNIWRGQTKCRECDKEAETSDHVEDCEKFNVYIGIETKEWWDKLREKNDIESDREY